MEWTGDDRLPPLRQRLGEAAWLLPRLLRFFGSTKTLGPVDGPPVLVIPGFVAHDRTTEALRKSLRQRRRRSTVEDGASISARASRYGSSGLRSRIDDFTGSAVYLSSVGASAVCLRGACPGSAGPGPRGSSPWIALLGASEAKPVWPLYERIAGHRSTIRRYPGLPTSLRCGTWRYGRRRDGLIAPRAARGLDEERDEEVSSNCTHMAFGMSARAAQDVVRRIDRFLKKDS